MTPQRRRAQLPMPEAWPRKRELVWAATAAILFAAYTFGWAEQTGRDATAGIAATADARAQAAIAQRLAWHYQALAAHRTGQLARCMNSRRDNPRAVLTWIDPHTGAEMGTFCDTLVLSKGKPRRL